MSWWNGKQRLCNLNMFYDNALAQMWHWKKMTIIFGMMDSFCLLQWLLHKNANNWTTQKIWPSILHILTFSTCFQWQENRSAFPKMHTNLVEGMHWEKCTKSMNNLRIVLFFLQLGYVADAALIFTTTFTTLFCLSFAGLGQWVAMWLLDKDYKLQQSKLL